MRSPLMLFLLLGVLCALLLPPFVDEHEAVFSIHVGPPNRMWAHFYATPEATELSEIPILRQSRASVRAEHDIHKSHGQIGFSYQTYLQRYIPMAPPDRDCVFFSDFDSDGFTDLVYMSHDDDSTFLYFYDALSKAKKRQVFFPDVEELRLAFMRYFQRPGDSLLYIVAISKVANGHFRSRLYSYDYKMNSAKELLCCEGVAQSYMFEGYLDQILLTVKHRGYYDFWFCNIDSGSSEKLVVDQAEVHYILAHTNNLQVEPYIQTTEILFNRGDRMSSLSRFDLDSLFLARKVHLDYFFKSESEDANIRVKYARDGVVFYTVEYPDAESEFYKYDIVTKKSVLVRHRGNPKVGQVLFYGDIDGNGRHNLVFTDVRLGKEGMYIWEEGDYYDIVRYPITREKLQFHNCLLEKQGKLYFESKGVSWGITYRRNPDAYLRWLGYIGTVTFFGFIGFLISYYKEMGRKKQQENDNTVLQLQLENVQRRVDPHFMFNALNNLGSIILKGEKHDSYDYLSSISGVLYKALQNRGILVTVEDELNFCSHYLEIQQKRFEGKFDYVIDVDDDLDISNRMPSNILNSMVGNCIKHGFANIKYKGHITIEFTAKKEGMLIVVVDNGRGRKATQSNVDRSQSTGTGLDICNQYVKLLNTKRKRNLLAFNIIDLYDDYGNACGTRCEYYVPLGLAY